MEGGKEMIVEVTEVSRELAALVAVVSLAMVGISVRLLPPCWHRFQHNIRTLSSPARKSAFWLLALLHLPIVWAAVFAGLSVKFPDYMPDIFIFVIVGTILLVLLIEIGLVIKRRIKKQITVKVEPRALAYSTALSYLAHSVWLNIVAIIGVSSTMLLIDIGPFRAENFEWGKWFLYIAIFTFCVGTIMFGLTLAFDKDMHNKDGGQEEKQN